MPSPKRTAITLSGQMRHALRSLAPELAKKLPVEAMRDYNDLHEYEVLVTHKMRMELYALAESLETDRGEARDDDPLERYAYQLLYNLRSHFIRRMSFSAREPDVDTPRCALVSEHPLDDDGNEKVVRRRKAREHSERLEAEGIQRRQGEAMIERAYRTA